VFHVKANLARFAMTLMVFALAVLVVLPNGMRW